MDEAGAGGDLTNRLFQSETEGHEMAVVVDALHARMIHPVQHPEQPAPGWSAAKRWLRSLYAFNKTE